MSFLKIFPKYILFILPILMGIGSVVQGTFNRLILNSWDILAMAFFNALVVFIVSGVLILLQYINNPHDQSFLAINFNINDIKWWFFIPPLTIVFITIGMAFSISKMSATTVFVLFIFGQLCASLIWDGLVKGDGFPLIRILGVLMVFVGGIFTSKL